VDDPAAAFDAELHPVEPRERIGHLQSVIHDAVSVYKSHNHRLGYILLSLHDVSVCKTVFLVFISDQLVFIVTKIYYFVPILGVELTFFVHVQHPRIFMDLVVHGAVVECAGLEK